MTRNDTPDKLKWSIRPRSGVDSAQWDWGINKNTLLYYSLPFINECHLVLINKVLMPNV